MNDIGFTKSNHEREWIVTLKNKDDLQEFYHDMEHACPDKSSVPTRECNVCLRRPISRNTHYILTDAEAVQLRLDERVLDVQLRPEELGMIKRPLGFVNNTPYSITGNFVKSGIDSSYRQWGHLHCAGEDADRAKGQWGSNTTLTGIFTTTNVYNNGKHVDVIICDDKVSYDCEEWYSPSTNTTRFVQYQWYNELNSYVSSIDDDSRVLPTGDINYVQNAVNDDFHGVHVCGTVAGQHYGWANEANIYALQTLGTGSVDVLLLFDYLRAFHKHKPVNPVTGRRNPTITNHSWGYGLDLRNYYPSGWTIDNFVSITWDGVTYSASNPNPSGWTLDGCRADFGVGTNTYDFPSSYTALLADIDDAVEDGVVVLCAAGNDNKYGVDPGHQHYNNRVVWDIGGFYLCRGGSPANAPKAICVGALSRWDDFRRSTYTNYGPSVDIFAPGDHILSSITNPSTSSFGGGFTDAKYTQGSGNWYYPLQGTSMATPQVAGIVAINASGKVRYTNDDVLSYFDKQNITNDMTFDIGTGDFSDNTCQFESPNKYILAKNTRNTTGLIGEQAGVRSTGMCFPRTKVLNTAGETSIAIGPTYDQHGTQTQWGVDSMTWGTTYVGWDSVPDNFSSLEWDNTSNWDDFDILWGAQD